MENKIISVEFEYALPDDYLAQSSKLNKTGTWTYLGPEVISIYFEKDTNNFRTFKVEEGEVPLPVPIDCYSITVNAVEHPLICCATGADSHKDYGSLDTVTEVLKDGSEYTRPATPPPDHTYEFSKLSYDPVTQTFNQLPWKESSITWEHIRAARNTALSDADLKTLEDTPPALKAKWEEYKTTLRNLPQAHGATKKKTTPTTAPWKVALPKAP